MNKKDLIIIYYVVLFISSLILSSYNIIYSEAIFYFLIFNIFMHIGVINLYIFIKNKEKWFLRIGIIFIMTLLCISTINILKNYIKDYISDKAQIKLYSYTIKKENLNYYVLGNDENLNKYKFKIIIKDAIKVQESKKEYVNIIYYKNTNIVKMVK